MSGELFVGLMSGTSLDGVDAALVSIYAGRASCLSAHYKPYAEDFRRELLAIQLPGGDELRRSALLANRLADIYAEATNELLAKAGTAATAVRAIGCHGQTVRHAPADGYTLQLNNPARVAEQTGIATVADFRNRDIAAGGQGAPLVPAFHDAMFRAPERHRVIVNIGGLANLTNLAPGHPTSGFDCGPGNMLLDAWASRHLGTPYDDGGHWAMQGHVSDTLLAKLRRHPFFAASPPKSCGREEFGSIWLDGVLDGEEVPADVQATLIALTATTIADAVARWCGSPTELFVCGGGARNDKLMSALVAELPGIIVGPTDLLGLPTDRVEAVAFAWLAYRTWHNLPGNLPDVTGAQGPRILGAVYPA